MWKDKLRYFLKEWVLTLGIAFLVAFFFRTTIASPRHIPTGSMIPTIKVGEFIFVNMFEYDWHIPFTRKSWIERNNPKRGDIIVFEYPKDPSKDYIKRVIGVPGDIVEVRDKRVILNGQPLPLEPVKEREILEDLTPRYNPNLLSLYKERLDDVEYYVLHINDRRGQDEAAVQIPANSYFVMGDNRDDSQDSRSWGIVPREKILGEGTFIWFSFNKDHFPFIRFSRIFTMLN